RGMALPHKKFRFVSPYSADKVIYRREDLANIPEVAAIARIATKVNGFTPTSNYKASPQMAIGIAPVTPSPMSGWNVVYLDVFIGNVLLIPTRSLYFLFFGKGLQQSIQPEPGKEGRCWIHICQQLEALGITMIPVIMGHQDIVQA